METITEYLRRLYDKRHEKGDDGLRTTREVAEYFDVSLATARRRCHALWEAGEIQAYDGGASGHMGNAIFWGLPK